MLTLQELNDIRERVRLDKLEDEGLQKRFGRRRPTCDVDREKLLEEVDLLKLEVGALTIELHKAKSEVTRLSALCDVLDAARDKAFSRLDEKTAEFDFPFHLHGSPAREKAAECSTCGYTPCQCDQT